MKGKSREAPPLVSFSYRCLLGALICIYVAVVAAWCSLCKFNWAKCNAACMQMQLLGNSYPWFVSFVRAWKRMDFLELQHEGFN